MERKCDICSKPIAKERVLALPTTKRCVSCAAKKGSDLITERRNVSMDIETYKDLLNATRN